MKVIEVDHITKDYGNQKGVFDVSFFVNKGEVVGFLGPNGAGKTTTIRQLMGFLHPDEGKVSILGMDCFEQASTIQKSLGYLPGEITFMDDMTGLEFLHFIAKMKKMKDFSYAENLMSYFELDPKGKIKKMSKGMKQKIGIVCAFMNQPDILILDEPTSGLDPLMQNKFVDLILEEKKRGATILMSSHLFEEVEKTCDRAVIIKEGKIMEDAQIEKLKHNRKKVYEITFASREMATQFLENTSYKEAEVSENVITISISSSTDQFIKSLATYEILDLNVKTQSLEELFMTFYGGKNND